MDYSELISIDQFLDETLSPNVRQILTHLCELDEPGYGSFIEWCEARGDCTQAVVCPHCGQQFVIEPDELSDLQRIAARTDTMLACGVRFD
ncbi:MAG TPA: hypothetical protein PK691_07805 [Thermomicrobiales bacterium]|nr:hypothetical protein [Thermomicrobiales bacterium]HRA48260.1 hypothetical protein [Thermomicrobiales bacterium]